MAAGFRMDDEAWRRHANPWSVWTRFAAVRAVIAALGSRAWLGWWYLLPVAAVAGWLWLDPHVFPTVTAPRTWAPRRGYGERLWLADPALASAEHRRFHRLLVPLRAVSLGLPGYGLVGYGLVVLDVWPTACGAALLVLGQLRRIDRFGMLYGEGRRRGAAP
ncbi:DUF6653 family protein [Marinitenerispora sediminis]|uniref:DUF6653 family protein n=1 Tax=Marinitenerispora sediminis TaxID=1931232 RepID=UPI0028683037|nr:DUF6653 family protein [Marinitenerispora sediminis]